MTLQDKLTSFARSQVFVLLLVFIALNAYFGYKSEYFLNVENYFNMLKQSSALLIAASAATLLMMTANFDLSAGANLAFSGVLYAMLAAAGVPLSLAVLLTLLAGACFGIINGVLVTKWDIPPFIATLGMMFIGAGLALVVCGGQSVRSGLPDNFSDLMNGRFLGIPTPILMAIVGCTFFWVLANKTLLGKYAMAIGSNKNAAVLSGINVNFITMSLFVVVALLASLAGIMTASRLGTGDPRVYEIFYMDIIVAMMLGGTPLTGGKGSVLGTLIAAMIIVVIGNGLSMLNVLIFWQTIIKGVVLIAAMILNERAKSGSLAGLASLFRQTLTLKSS
ncbi:ABC transporter permease [Pseudovibrio sp. Tun.PSC04-5.I4]|uniref:ABC transporter permease n=1 Tax=Pseudovibrio sp. Tun.PSC04-5.I4 TaxID=1798213 RepID=UPI0008815F3A|nr:ABC transporter permease [Pseudovibrio sp. Tun.PSC04-5.I4]SDR47793.1 monosaccharide ABC transporter membrane protein, CUT2 family [Pseudovibrio sp. Tun.PSC04-5.I4]